jgi:hypothetical protein
MESEIVCGRISSLPLFANVGRIILDVSVSRIASWDDWTGPEDPLVGEIHIRQQEIHDSIIAAEEEEVWADSLNAAVTLLSKVVPYDSNQDTYFGPNMAVWHAAWTFALEVAHVTKRLRCPPEIEGQVQWFANGHWPRALKQSGKMQTANDYVVY